MSLRPVAVPVLLAILLCSAPVWAEDPATTTSPAAAYDAKIAGLPAPAAEHGFRLDGILRLNGKVLGHATVLAEPGGENGEVWRVGDQLVIKTGAQPRIEISQAFFSRTLGMLRGTVQSNKPGEAGIQWVKTDTGFRGTTKVQDGQVTTERVRNFEHAGSALTTLAGTILFARFALPEKATYQSTIFEVESGMKGEKALHAVTLEVHGERELDGQQVLYVTGQKGEQKLELLFKPEGRELVGVRFEEGEQRIEILKGDVWSSPARDPVAGSLRAALAFGTGDVALLDDVIYWPSFYKSLLAGNPVKEGEQPPAMEAVRKQLLAQWRKTLPKNAPEMIKSVLPQMRAQIKTRKLEGGDVEVLFPEIFRSMKLRMGRQYGFWHLVALPGVGKPADAPKPAPKQPAPPKKDGAPKDG
jgi:hypothetical protein